RSGNQPPTLSNQRSALADLFSLCERHKMNIAQHPAETAQCSLFNAFWLPIKQKPRDWGFCCKRWLIRFN
ncbi:hypothetical protein L6232_22905, partial [Shewanella sp. C31]|nr:hypothetical protein [Shewanella electrica]